MKNLPAGILIGAILFSIPPAGWSADWGPSLSVISSEVQDGVTNALLRDSSGRSFSVSFAKTVSPERIGTILEIRDIIHALTELKISSLRFSVNDTGVTAAAGVESFLWNGSEFAAYLPSGVAFVHDTALRYGFRLLSRGIYVRIEGDYSTRGEMAEKIKDAAEDPVGYIRRREPEYILSRIAEQDRKMEMIKRSGVELYSGRPTEQQTVEEILKVRNAHPAFTAGRIAAELKKQGIRATARQVKAVLILHPSPASP